MPLHFVTHPHEAEETHALWYERRGRADAPVKLVFTMGLGGTANQWEAQTAFFDTRPDVQYVVYDNRGLGFSDPVAGRWTTSKMARDALSLLGALGWSEGVHAIGLSMGGMITQEMLRQAKPGQFASLTLISTIAGGPFSLYLFIGSIPTGLQLAARTFLTTDPKTQLKNGLRLLYPDSFLEGESLNPATGKMEKNFKAFRRALIKRGVEAKKAGMPPMRVTSIFKQAFAVFSHSVSEAELKYVAQSVRGHVLVVTGDDDILVHPDNSTRLARELSAELVWIKGAGHGANEQCAPDVNAAIERNVRAAQADFEARRAPSSVSSTGASSSTPSGAMAGVTTTSTTSTMTTGGVHASPVRAKL